MLSQTENIKRVKAEIDRIVACSHNSIYVIIDGDRTLIPTDSTKFFFEHLNLDYNDIKNIFKQHGYSFDAFYNVALYYSKIEIEIYNLACTESASRVNIYPEFLSFIDTIKEKVQLILITSGISQSWQNVINNHSLDFIHLIGGNYFPTDNFVVDKQAKGIIANVIKNANKKVFAFGDTMIDFEMLKAADYAYLVLNEKQNKDFIPFANEISHLKQVSFSNYYHSDIPTINLKEVAEQILAL
jgi:phosphoserine phosphatase